MTVQVHVVAVQVQVVAVQVQVMTVQVHIVAVQIEVVAVQVRVMAVFKSKKSAENLAPVGLESLAGLENYMTTVVFEPGINWVENKKGATFHDLKSFKELLK